MPHDWENDPDVRRLYRGEGFSLNEPKRQRRQLRADEYQLSVTR
jgi:hypothetical protein